MRCPRRRSSPLRGLSRALRYGFAAHDRKGLVVEAKRYANVDVPYRRQKSVVLVVQSRWMDSWTRAPTWSAMSTW